MRMMLSASVAFLALGLATAPSAASDEIRTETVHFKAGASGTTIKGRIKGYGSVSYLLGANAGQVMRVKLTSRHTATYFNIYAPGKGPGDEAIAVSEMSDPINTFEGVLPAKGQYTISVYMMRSAARRNEVSDFSLDIAIDAKASADTGASSDSAKAQGSDFSATGQVPCARYAGQPMGQCEFGVTREGNGNGAITVFWPDGGSRVIFFEMNTPARFDKAQADGDAEMTVGTNADLYLVTIGDQRFEIPEAVMTGG
ncbi:hypothetical protein [Zhengella mangrovi]|uniref:hypothetical protein n=1 Tax=Zhengella mangrovi TaxID=1982044 RepID=UPI00197B9C41|nr:hypothetical protein [Zhengella mangrovi]